MKKYFILIFTSVFCTCSILPVFADFNDTTDLLLKENDAQIRMNQYEVTKQLNTQKMNILKKLNQVSPETAAPVNPNGIIQTQRQRQIRMYGKNYLNH